MAQEGQLYRIAVLIDDLKHEEIQTRINSVKALKEISAALGPERTRNELIPFLDDTSVDDEDEVLLALAEELGGLTDQVGGPAHIHTLLKPLEQLANVEEPTVRDKAIESLHALVRRMSDKQVADMFLPLVTELAQKEWFTSRMSACALLAAAYPRVLDQSQAELRGTFGKLSKDDTPMVRRAAATSLAKFAGVIQPELIRTELVPIFQVLSKDDQDSVRLLVMQNIIAIGSLIENEEKKREVLMMTFDIAKDKAWRVRWTVAQNYLEVAKLLKIDKDNEDLPKFVKLFVSLLRDEEAEVRTAATLRMTEVGKVFSPIVNLVAEEFIPPIRELCEDAVEFVRSAVASVILGMAPVVGRAKTTEFLVPFYLALLRDGEPEVRLNLIGKLDDLGGVISVTDLSDALLPSVRELAKDGQWRIRHSIIKHIPLLAKHLSVQIFETNLLELCMNWLVDEVYSIREAATNNLKNLAEIYGEAWARQHLIPKVTEMNANPSYLFRMQALRAVESLASVLSADLVNTDLVPLVVRMGEDPTPNIRFNVAKCFSRIYTSLEHVIIENDVKPCLRILAEDTDHDVKYFAGQTLKTISASTKV